MDALQCKSQIDAFCKDVQFAFCPLQVEVLVGSPIIITYPWINFDGIIAYGMGAIVFGKDWQSLASSAQFDAFWSQLPMPLCRTHSICRASIGRFDQPQAQGHADFSKPLSIEEIGYCAHPQDRYMIVGGDFKMHRKRYMTNTSRKITFWLLGDPAWIGRICKEHLPGIGKRIAAGFGRVIDFSIAAISEDWSLWHPKWGINRPIPVRELPCHPWLQDKALGSLTQGYVAARFPYWAKANHELCIIPEGFL